MTTDNPSNRWTDRLAIVAVAIVLGIGMLQWVADAMTCPGADAMAQSASR